MYVKGTYTRLPVQGTRRRAAEARRGSPVISWYRYKEQICGAPGRGATGFDLTGSGGNELRSIAPRTMHRPVLEVSPRDPDGFMPDALVTGTRATEWSSISPADSAGGTRGYHQLYIYIYMTYISKYYSQLPTSTATPRKTMSTHSRYPPPLLNIGRDSTRGAPCGHLGLRYQTL